MTHDVLEVLSLEASLDDLKSLYRILDDQREAYPELDDNRFLDSLERLLRAQAQSDGVDAQDEIAFSRWLYDDGLVPGRPSGGSLLN
jgi:hypothetical protein